MAGEASAVGDTDFDEQVLAASMPTVVDFWTESCAPCKTLAPLLDELATKYAGRVQIRKMNATEHPVTSTRYFVRAFPTLLVFKEGRVVDQVVGMVSRGKLEDFVTRHL